MSTEFERELRTAPAYKPKRPPIPPIPAGRVYPPGCPPAMTLDKLRKYQEWHDREFATQMLGGNDPDEWVSPDQYEHDVKQARISAFSFGFGAACVLMLFAGAMAGFLG